MGLFSTSVPKRPAQITTEPESIEELYHWYRILDGIATALRKNGQSYVDLNSVEKLALQSLKEYMDLQKKKKKA